MKLGWIVVVALTIGALWIASDFGNRAIDAVAPIVQEKALMIDSIN